MRHLFSGSKKKRNPLDSKLWRELFAAKGMLGAIAGIMLVGVLFFVGMTSIYYNLEQSRQLYYSQCRMADFTISLKKMPLVELEQLEGMPGITELRPRIVFHTTVDLESVDRPLSGMLLSLPPTPKPILNNVVVREGSYFTDSLQPEILVNESFARERNIKPGDTIHLVLNERKQEFRVVGTAMSSEFVYVVGSGGIIPDPANFGVFYIKEELAEDLFDFQGACNEICGMLTPALRERPQILLDQIETMLEPYGVAQVTPLKDQSSHFFLKSEIDNLWVFAFIIPMIFLTVAAFILNILMLRVIEQQRTVIGTLKAIGYSDRHILWHYLKFGSAIGLTAGLLGATCGYFYSDFLTSDVYSQYFEFPRLISRAYPSMVLSGLLMSLGFSLMGSWRGARIVLKLQPAEAMRPKPPISGKRIWLERWPKFWKSFSVRTQRSLRGLMRNRMRAFAGIFAAAMGTMLMLVIFLLSDGMNEMIQFQFTKVLVNDYEISFKGVRDYGAFLEARQMPGVDYAEPVLHVGCTLKNGHHKKKVSITGLIPDSTLTIPIDQQGNRQRLPEAGILISKRLAEILNVQTGDLLTMIPTEGEQDERTVPISGVITSYLGLIAYADLDYLNRLINEERVISKVQMKTDPDPLYEKQFLNQLKQLPVIQGISSGRKEKELLQKTMTDQIMISLTITIIFSGLIFFGSVLNSSLISLSERQQETATLHVLGYSSQEIASLFLQESLILNLIGITFGLPLGILLNWLMCKSVETDLFRIPVVVDPWSLVMTVFVGLGFTLLAHIPLKRAIDHLDWANALNVKE